MHVKVALSARGRAQADAQSPMRRGWLRRNRQRALWCFTHRRVFVFRAAAGSQGRPPPHLTACREATPCPAGFAGQGVAERLTGSLKHDEVDQPHFFGESSERRTLGYKTRRPPGRVCPALPMRIGPGSSGCHGPSPFWIASQNGSSSSKNSSWLDAGGVAVPPSARCPALSGLIAPAGSPGSSRGSAPRPNRLAGAPPERRRPAIPYRSIHAGFGNAAFRTERYSRSLPGASPPG